MGGSRKRHGQKKSENNPPESWYNELVAVKETIAGLQKKLENSIEKNEMLRCLNTVLVNDLKMEKESKMPFMQAFQVIWHGDPAWVHEHVLDGWTLDRTTDEHGIWCSIWPDKWPV